MKNFWRVTIFVCIIALLGVGLLPGKAELQSGSNKSKINLTKKVELPIQGKINAQEHYDQFLKLRERVESLTGEELLLYKQLLDALGAEHQMRTNPIRNNRPRLAAVGGEDCATAPTFAASFMDSDDTSGTADDVDPGGTACTGFASSGAGGDLVYELLTGTSGVARVTMDPTDVSPADDDLALYVLDASIVGPDPCVDPTTSCLIGDDFGAGGAAEQVVFPVVSGTSYFIVVDGFAGDEGPFDLNVEFFPPPANDDCSAATVIDPLANPQTLMENTIAATTPGTDPLMSCGAPPNSNSVWFSYTAPTEQMVAVNTNGSDYDTVLTVWCADCPTPMEEIACDDDGGIGLQSSLTFKANGGDVYLIEVTDFGGPGGGDLDLNIASMNIISPANDDCAAATAVAFGGPGVFMECVNTTLATDECGEVGLGGMSIWYRVTAGRTGLLVLGTFGFQGVQFTNFDTTIDVFPDGPCLPPVPIASNDDFGGDLRSQVVIPATVGETFLVRVAGFGGAGGRACVRFVQN